MPVPRLTSSLRPAARSGGASVTGPLRARALGCAGVGALRVDGAVGAGGAGWRVEQQAHAAHAAQVARLGGALAQLATQPRHVDVDGAVAAAVRLAPHLGQELALADDLAAS